MFDKEKMSKFVRIPNDLWDFVGKELIRRGYINRDVKISSIKEPSIRWLLLDNDEWQIHTQLNVLNLNNWKSVQEIDWNETFYLNLFAVETMKRKKILKKFPETKRTIIKKGFMNCDNVILMNESITEDIFNESREKCKAHIGDYIYSLDSIRLSILILELIKIYKFKLGKLFVGEVPNEGILQNEILEVYLRAHQINPKYFELPIFLKSKEQQEFEDTVHLNIWKALQQKKSAILKDNRGKEIARFNISELFKEEKGRVYVSFGDSTGPKIKGNFVGLGHILFSPNYFGAKSAKEFLDAWNWFVTKTHVDAEKLQMALETCSLMQLLVTGVEEGKDVAFFSLIINLRKLDSLGIDITAKIEEFGEELRGRIRSFWKLEKTMWKAIFVAKKLREYLFNVSSECFLARIAGFYGFSVKLGKHPDLKIDSREVEVKRANSFNLSSTIEAAKGQQHDIIAIEADSLTQRPIPYHKSTWLNEGNMIENLKKALTLEWNGEIVLLFKGLKARIVLLENMC